MIPHDSLLAHVYDVSAALAVHNLETQWQKEVVELCVAVLDRRKHRVIER